MCFRYGENFLVGHLVNRAAVNRRRPDAWDVMRPPGALTHALRVRV
jgi:hypothetical protein